MARKTTLRGYAVADDLTLPPNAATQKIAWFGRTGSGKTYGAKRFVEQMLDAGVQVVVVDTMGVWAGLRLGEKPFPVYVLGGLYGDLPLEPDAGEFVASLAVERGVSAVLDVSLMTDAERTRFLTAFGRRFFERKRRSRSAVHIVLDEAQDVVPQEPQRGEEKLLHEWHRVAKQGRALGIGVSFVSQRPQEVNKKALNQCECVFAFQLTGPHERKALQYWLSTKGADEKLSDVLPRLEVGNPYVWSPSWLDVSRQVRVLPIRSRDTSRTPVVGERAYQEAALSEIDVAKLREEMAAAVKRAEDDDPAVLRAEVARLRKKVTVLEKRVPDPAEPVVDVKALAAVAGRIEKLVRRIETAHAGVACLQADLVGERDKLASMLGDLRLLKRGGTVPVAEVPGLLHRTVGGVGPVARRDVEPRMSPVSLTVTPFMVGGGALRRVMTALAQRSPLTRTQIGVRSGVSVRSSTFSNNLGRARANGWVEVGSRGISITAAGEAALGEYEALPTGSGLREYWLSRFGDSAGGRVLRVLCDAYPGALTRETIGKAAGVSVRSSTFSNNLGKLRALELVESVGAELRASPELFSDALPVRV